MSVLYITVTPKNRPPRQYRFTKRKVIIGGVSGNDIVIDGEPIARRQCKITLEGERIFIVNFGSSAGAQVNNSRVGSLTSGSATQLHPRDKIRMGETQLRVYLDEAEDEGATQEDLLQEANDPARQPWRLYKETALLRRILAARPDAPPWLLEQLSARADLETLRAVAKNPNTPPKTLSLLAECCALELLQNPTLPLLFLEDPLLSQFSPEAICTLLLQDAFPADALGRFARHEEELIRCAVARSPKATAALIEATPIYPGEQALLNTILEANHFAKGWLEALCQQGTIEQREMLARSHTLPDYAVELLARDPEEEVRWWLARRHSLPRQALLALASDPSSRVRLRLAGDLSIQEDNLLQEILAILVQDQDAAVRAKIASLFITPKEILESLSRDEDEEIRREASRRLSQKT